jgi:hypothetical protein
MKIIINEEQNKSITTFIKNKSLIEKLMIDGYSVKEIENLIGLTTEQLFDYILDIKTYYTCDQMESLLFDLYKTGKYFNSIYTYNEFKITRKFNYFSGVVEFKFVNNDYEITGYATPFYEGKCRFPFDVEVFYDKKNDYESYDDIYSSSVNFSDGQFETIRDFIDYFNNDYYEIIINEIPKIIDYYLKHD